jgi:hypothetical protein
MGINFSSLGHKTDSEEWADCRRELQHLKSVEFPARLAAEREARIVTSCLELLADDHITVQKAREWLSEWVLEGVSGPLVQQHHNRAEMRAALELGLHYAKNGAVHWSREVQAEDCAKIERAIIASAKG